MNNRIFQVLQNKKFLFLWIAEVFSQVAFNMMNFMLLLVAFKISNSNTAVSGIVISFTIPAIFFGIFAGAYADKWNKRSVLLNTNLIRGILLVILAFIHSDLIFIYLMSFLISIATQFFIPAETPVIPLVTPKRHLLSANALFGLGIYGSIFVAYALSGPFLIFFGIVNSFLILASFFFIASIFIYLISIPPLKKEGSKETGKIEAFKEGFVAEIKEALKVIAASREIYRSLFLLTLSQVLILSLAVIGPGFAKQVLGIQVDDLSLVFVTPAALGMVAGAVVIGNYFHNFKKSRLATIGVFLAGLSMILLPLGAGGLHIVSVLAFILGVANALIFVPSNTLLQEETSEEFRGKIYGTLSSLIGIFSIIPIVLIGGTADIFGVGFVLSAIGIILLLFGGLRVIF